MADELELSEFPEDMSIEEQEALKKFIQDGSVGISSIAESDVFQWFGGYMAGKTYTEISVATKKQKEYILFMAYKQKWFDKKMKHFDDLLNNMQENLKQTKLESVNTMRSIVSSLNKYYEDKFNRYILKNDKTIIEGLDTKLLSQYYKSIETLDKILAPTTPKGGGSGPTNINLNLTGESATVEQKDDNTLEISSGSKAGELLKKLAAAKKIKSSEND